MAEEEVVAAEEEAPEAPYVAGPGNCAGELELIPASVEGLTFNMYKCKVCSQLVHVGHEHLEVYGLPPEHAKLVKEE